MSPLSEAQKSELDEKHAPVLVLYPEIDEGTRRERDPDYPQVSPLSHDYHPRDIRMVLDHATLRSGRWRPAWRWFSGRFGFGKARAPGSEALVSEMVRRRGKTPDLKLLPGADGSDRRVPLTDPRDRDAYWAGYGAIRDKDTRYPRACYARVVEGAGITDDRVLLQYWYPYYYNDFWNIHEMDWECAMVLLSTGELQPQVCVLSAHMGGHWLPWSDTETAVDESTRSDSGARPVVYVSNGSHAAYFHGPAMAQTASPAVAIAVRRFGRLRSRFLGGPKPRSLRDYTLSWEDGSRHLVQPHLLPSDADNASGPWGWLGHQGRWGAAGHLLDLEFGDDAPKGPRFAGDKWDDPFTWIALNCTLAPSQREEVVPTLWTEPSSSGPRRRLVRQPFAGRRKRGERRGVKPLCRDSGEPAVSIVDGHSLRFLSLPSP